jgi:hypothetical protein
VLTLLIVPAAFSLADGLEKRLGPKLRKLAAHLRAGKAWRGRGGRQPAE